MRYLIVTYDDYFNIPYIQFYEQALKEAHQEYDILLWNRSGQKVDLPNAIVFSAKDYHSKIAKLKPFLAWRRFTLDVLKRKHYDRLIVLTTMPGVLIADKLLREYRGKYWLDIRDFTYENVFFYKDIVKGLVFGAQAVSISSPAFQSFLPESENIVLTHNITNEEFLLPKCTLDTAKRPLNLAFVGGIRFYEQNMQLLRQFKNREAFHLSYVGKPHLGCDLPAFCRREGIENVSFQGRFTNDEKPEIFRNVDLINCIYGNDTNVSRLLLPNRLYDCCLFKKHMIVSKGTYLAKVVEQYHLGLAVDVEQPGVPEAILDYLASYDQTAFEEGCRAFLEVVHTDVAKYQKVLNAFCAGE